MDEQTRLNQLNEDIRAAVDVVDIALESDEESRQISAGKLVEELALRYREILSGLPDKEREEAERGIGRRLTDLRRAAAALSRRDSGRAIPLARDHGMLPFIEQRQPPKSIVPQRAAPSGGKLSVGSEVDSWCGKCKEMTTHNIVAMVGDQAKQVICQVCSSRHEHRTEPPLRHRNAARPGVVSDGGGGAAGATRRGNEDRELAKRQEAKRLLQKELNEAVDPRPFDPKGRYKAGEIIAHPEYGRGKIENVLRGSLLVRFLEGLRPLNLQ